MKSALQCLREFRSFAFWIYFLVAPSLEHWRADFTLWFQLRFWESDINFFLRVEEIAVFPHKLSSSIFRFLQQRYSSVVPGQGGFEKRMGWFWHCLFADMGSTIHHCQTQFMGGVNTAKPSQFQVYRSRSHTPPAHKWLDFICLAPYYRDTYWGNNGRHTSILDPLGGCSLRLLIQVVAKKRFSFLGIGRFLNQAYTLPCMFWKLFGF